MKMAPTKLMATWLALYKVLIPTDARIPFGPGLSLHRSARPSSQMASGHHEKASGGSGSLLCEVGYHQSRKGVENHVPPVYAMKPQKKKRPHNHIDLN